MDHQELSLVFKTKLFAKDIIFAKFHPEKPLNFMIGTPQGFKLLI